MNHPETHVVTSEHGPRPAGAPNICFYCGALLGDQHRATCVMRTRTVVMQVTVEYVQAIPESWDAGQIASHHNESSWCASNVVKELARIRATTCLCQGSQFRYVREATAEDESGWDLDLVG